MVNKCILVGNLGKDPEYITLNSGIGMVEFSLATSESWKDKDGNRQTKTEWHNIKAFRGLADVIHKYVHKGDPIYIEGKITTESWEKDGEKKYKTVIVANDMKMLGKKSESSSSTPEKSDVTDDLPF